MNALEIFQYQNTPVSFKNEDGKVFINATEMAKRFDKQPVNWLNLQSTTEYISELTKLRNSSLADLVQVTKGGNTPGTWMSEDVSLEFARWLSPAFAIWCNDRIKELLKSGYTKLDTISRKDLAKMLYEAEDEKERVMQENQKQRTVIEKTEKMLTITSSKLEAASPKIDFCNRVTDSTGLFPFNKVAKILQLPFGRNILFEKLRQNGVLMKNNEPYQSFIDQGYFVHKHNGLIEGISKKTGLSFSIAAYQTFVTGKGMLWLSRRFGGKNPHYKSRELILSNTLFD